MLAQVMQLPLAAEAVRAAEERCVGSASLAARLFRPVQRMCVLPPSSPGPNLNPNPTPTPDPNPNH